MLASIENATRRFLEKDVLVDLVAAGVGIGLTTVPENVAFGGFYTDANKLFGSNGVTPTGKGSLTLTQVLARTGLYAAEAIAGLAVADDDGPLGVGAGAFAGAAAWHWLRMLKVNYLGTGPLFGVPALAF